MSDTFFSDLLWNALCFSCYFFMNDVSMLVSVSAAAQFVKSLQPPLNRTTNENMGTLGIQVSEMAMCNLALSSPVNTTTSTAFHTSYRRPSPVQSKILRRVETFNPGVVYTPMVC